MVRFFLRLLRTWVLSLLPVCSAVPSSPGRPDVFPRSRLTTTSSPLLSSPTLLLVTSSRSTGTVSMDTVFGVVLVESQFKAYVARWMQEHWSVQPCIQVLIHRRSFQTLWVSILHDQALVFLLKLETRGGADNLSPAGVRFLGLRRSSERVKASRPPARGRLAGGAGV